MLMKPIELEIDEDALNGHIDEDGEYTFSLYTSNCCSGEFESAIQTLMQIWDLETEVNLTINVRTKSIYTVLYEMRSMEDGVVGKESQHLFEALRKDCQWIVDRIDNLKYSEEYRQGYEND